MTDRLAEQDEFLLSQLLDGDLPPEESAALRDRLAREPALRGAYDALVRVDAALLDQRDELPAVDWDSFHGRVMDAVSAEGAHEAPPIRFPFWARTGGPLATVAAIALLVTVYRMTPEQADDPLSSGGRSLVQLDPSTDVESARAFLPTEPVVETPTRLAVQFARPRVNRGSKTPVVRVRYQRSEQTAGAIAKMDEEARNRPSYVAAMPRPSLRPGFIDLSNLGNLIDVAGLLPL